MAGEKDEVAAPQRRIERQRGADRLRLLIRVARRRDAASGQYHLHWTGLRDGQFFDERGPLLDFVRRLSALRTGHPVFRRRRFFLGDRRSRRARRAVRARTEEAGPEELPDLVWFTPDGTDMGDRDWSAGFSKALNVFLNGDAIGEPDPRGRQVRDDSFLVLVNAHDGELTFTLPPAAYGQMWIKMLDTADPLLAEEESPVVKARQNVQVADRSIQVLRRV